MSWHAALPLWVSASDPACRRCLADTNGSHIAEDAVWDVGKLLPMGVPGSDAAAAGIAASGVVPASAFQQGVADLREGWRYMCAPGNRCVWQGLLSSDVCNRQSKLVWSTKLLSSCLIGFRFVQVSAARFFHGWVCPTRLFLPFGGMDGSGTM